MEHVLIRWSSTNDTAYVPSTSVRLMMEGETRRRRAVQPIYTAEPLKKRQSTGSSNEPNTEHKNPSGNSCGDSSQIGKKRGRSRQRKTNQNEQEVDQNEEDTKAEIDDDSVDQQDMEISEAIRSPSFFDTDYATSFDKCDKDNDSSASPTKEMPPPPSRKLGEPRELIMEKIGEKPEENSNNIITTAVEKGAPTPTENELTSSHSPTVSQQSPQTMVNQQTTVEPTLQSEGSASDDEWGRREEPKKVECTIAPASACEVSFEPKTDAAPTFTSPISSPFNPRLTMDNYDISDRESFPVQLFGLLQDAKEVGVDHILSWESDGKTFRIRNDQEFLKLLTRLSANKKVISFRNTLGQFNFQCVEYGENGRAYQHISAFPPESGSREIGKVLFHKDSSLEDLQQIKRRRPLHKRSKESPNSSAEKAKKRERRGTEATPLEETEMQPRAVSSPRSLRASTLAATAESLERSESFDAPAKQTLVPSQFVASPPLQSRFRVASLSELGGEASKKRKRREGTEQATVASKKSKPNPSRHQKAMSRTEERKTRRLSNGCLLPKKGSTYQLGDGTWAKPVGSVPNGLIWDYERGLWAPIGGTAGVARRQRNHVVYRNENSSSSSEEDEEGEEDHDKDGNGDVDHNEKVDLRANGRFTSAARVPSDRGTPHRLVLHALSTGDFGGEHYADESLPEDQTIVRLSPCGKHHTLRTSPYFPTFLMFKKRHVFKGHFKAKTKANPTGTIGGDNGIMKDVKKDNFAKIQRLLHRERTEEDESSSHTLSSTSSGESTVPAVQPALTEVDLNESTM